MQKKIKYKSGTQCPGCGHFLLIRSYDIHASMVPQDIKPEKIHEVNRCSRESYILQCTCGDYIICKP